jgi:predicted outer membrane repeat protein
VYVSHYLGNPGELIINNSSFAANSAITGGGLYIDGTFFEALIQGSSITGNTSERNGGGIYSQASTVMITNSTISFQ